MAHSNKKDDFRQRSLWCIYDICDRNGNPCHNCRKRTKKSELSAQCRQPCEALAEWEGEDESGASGVGRVEGYNYLAFARTLSMLIGWESQAAYYKGRMEW